MKRSILFLLAIMCLAGCAKRSNQSTTDENVEVTKIYRMIFKFDTFYFLPFLNNRKLFNYVPNTCQTAYLAPLSRHSRAEVGIKPNLNNRIFTVSRRYPVGLSSGIFPVCVSCPAGMRKKVRLLRKVTLPNKYFPFL